MRLPLIKHVVDFVEEHDQDWVVETIQLLEYISEEKGMKDEELEIMDKMLSNLYGSLEVHREIKNGVPKKEAFNGFMKRVVGSIN